MSHHHEKCSEETKVWLGWADLQAIKNRFDHFFHGRSLRRVMGGRNCPFYPSGAALPFPAEAA
jgi:hypothetical protein